MSRDRRLLILFFFLFSLVASLIVRFFFIQIIEHDKWVAQAKSQHELLVTLPSKRGIFYGHAGGQAGHPSQDIPLVADVLKYHLFIDPVAIKVGFKEEVALKLAELISLDRTLIESHVWRSARSRKLTMWLDPEKREEIQEWWLSFAKTNRLPRNALYFIADYQRSYPHGKLLGQVLHTVCEEKDPRTGLALPTGGLELQFQKELCGKNGKSLLLRSPRHPLDLGIVLEETQDGRDVFLTINPYIQAIAEEEIEKAVKSAGAKSGFAVIMEPKTGEILALAQYPFFYPARYRDFFNNPELREETKVRSVTDAVEPGSSMKIIAMAIMLMANEELAKRGEPPLFDPTEKIACDRHFFPGRTQPLKDVRTHRFLNMNMAIQKSSNVYLGDLVERVIRRLGAKWYREQLVEVFGFGEKSGIELPSESPGFVPSPGKKYSNGHLEWSAPTPYSLIMGYNMLANSMQMLKAFSVFASRGYLVTPTLIRKIGDDDSRREAPRRVLSSHIAETMVRAMKYGTKPGGSGAKADIYGYTEAGKTGTSEKIKNGAYSKKDHFVSFIGFTPVSEPKFVMMIGIDEPKYRYLPGIGRTYFGGSSAAPAFRGIATRVLHYLGVAPDDPSGYPKGDPRSNLEEADWMKEVQELTNLYREWNG